MRSYAEYGLLPLFISDSGRRYVTTAVLEDELVERDQEPVALAAREVTRRQAGLLGRQREHHGRVQRLRVREPERQPVEGRVAPVPGDEVVVERGVEARLAREVLDVAAAVATLAAPQDLAVRSLEARRGRGRRNGRERDHRQGQGDQRAHVWPSVAPHEDSAHRTTVRESQLSQSSHKVLRGCTLRRPGREHLSAARPIALPGTTLDDARFESIRCPHAASRIAVPRPCGPSARAADLRRGRSAPARLARRGGRAGASSASFRSPSRSALASRTTRAPSPASSPAA